MMPDGVEDRFIQYWSRQDPLVIIELELALMHVLAKTKALGKQAYDEWLAPPESVDPQT